MKPGTAPTSIAPCVIDPRPQPAEAGHLLTPLQLAMVAGELSPTRWQRDLVQIDCHLDEAIDAEVLQGCFDRLAARHESLRVRLEWRGGDDHGRHAVDAIGGVPLQVRDLRSLSESDRDATIERLRAAAWTDPSDVLSPPRLRAMLLRLGDAEHVLVVTYQETVLDEHAGKLLVRELLELYDEAMTGTPCGLAPAVPFRDYLQWLDSRQDPDACHFWSDLLAEAPAPSPPPLLGVGRCDRSTAVCCGLLDRYLSEGATERLSEWVRSHGGTLNTALLAAWSVVVAHHAEDDDARFSAVFSERGPAYPNAETAVAMCFSVLPFVARGARRLPADELIGVVRDYEESAREHSVLLNDNPATRRQLGQPGAQTLIFFDEIDVNDFIHAAHPEWTHRRFELYGRNPYALAMRGFGGRRMRIQAWYNPGSYGRETVECLLDQLVQVLERLPEEDAPSGSRRLLPDDHDRRIREWSGGPVMSYEAHPLHRLIEEQTQHSPEATAVVDDAGAMSYRALDEAANRLAHSLRSQGLKTGDTVALCLGRTAMAVVAVLGVLKAGGIYVPIDASWPVDRARGALEPLHARAFVADCGRGCQAEQIAAGFGPSSPVVIYLDDPPIAPAPPGVRRLELREVTSFPPTPVAAEVTPDDIAYVIFTSGSTGTPKGVAVRHRAVCNLIDWARRAFDFGPGDRVLWVTSLGFDLSVFDLFGLLACGGSIRVASDADLQAPERLAHLLTMEPITFWDSAPQALDRLRRPLDEGRLAAGADTSQLRLVFLSGDWIPLALPGAVRRHFPNADVISLGGATEATVWSNAYPVERVEPEWRSIPYGRPIQNARYRILDESLEPCPIGVPGELYIGGDVLADGYAGDARQTRERFVADPFADSDNARLYRTGDSARWWPDGNIELLGRLDHQVKVRGYRIELGEVEHALKRHAAVRDAVAVARRTGAGENQLVAYVVRNGQTVSYADLREHLRRTLPDYMVPGAFVELDALPLTPNGKVDRRALPDPSTSQMVRERPYIEPRTPREKAVAQLFREALRMDRVGAEDSFFAIGGDSLSALGVIFSAERSGISITIDMLRTGTVAELAREAQALPPQRAVDPVGSAPQTEPVPLVPNQRWLLDRGFEQPAAYGFAAWLRPKERLDMAALEHAWRVVVDHHVGLRMRFHRAAGEIVQTVQPPGHATPIERINLRQAELDRFHVEANACARAIAQAVPLLDRLLPRLAVVHGPKQQDLLFLFIPHITTDEFSGRIVIDDLGAAYADLAAGRRPELPPATTPFPDWARRLEEHAGSDELASELAAIRALPWRKAGRLPRDSSDEANRYETASDLHRCLSRDETRSLLQAARERAVSVESVLVAALTHGVSKWTGSEHVPIDMTGNGREPLFGSRSLHRSAGYFSVIYPVMLRYASGGSDLADVDAVHAQLREAPGRGARYGLLRHAHPEAAVRDELRDLAQPEIKFNYHGLQPLCGEACPFEPAGIPLPPMLQPSDRRQYLLNLEVTCGREGGLCMAWKYSSAIHLAVTIERLADGCLENLRAWVASAMRDDREAWPVPAVGNSASMALEP